MSSLKFRAMRVGDLAAACELVRQFDPLLVDLAEEDFRYDLEHPAEWPEIRYRLVGEDGGKILCTMGYGPGGFPSDGIRWTNYLMVDQEHRREGLGSAIYQELEVILRQINCRKVYLDVGTIFKQPDAIAFHSSHGYRIEGILYDYWDAGEDLVIMAKELAS